MRRLTDRNFRLALLSAAGLGALLVGVIALTNAAQAQAQDKRASLMELKLEFAKNVLGGLALEQYDVIADNAIELKELSAAAEWEPVTVPGPLYLDYTREFQRIAQDMADKAKDENLDGATLDYVRLTMNCVACHKYVRTRDR